MALPRRLLPHEKTIQECPWPISNLEEVHAKLFPIPQTEEEWAKEAKIKKLDANDLMHNLGGPGFMKWLDESPTYCLRWAPSRIVPARVLSEKYKEMRPVIIEDLMRVGETMNIIAAPKSAKSWLALNIAMNVIGGGRLFDRFECKRGRVLIIDNELHGETITFRMRSVAEKMNVPHQFAENMIDLLLLRGNLTSIEDLHEELKFIRPHQYKIVILDAFYKFYPEGFDENSNSEMARLYTQLDRLAEFLRSGLILIHHASKGNSSGKSVTDMGAGAGTQSRACDAHLVLREHAEDRVFVIEMANRSFPPIEKFCARFTHPVWKGAPGCDPEELKGMVKKDGYGSKKVGGGKNARNQLPEPAQSIDSARIMTEKEMEREHRHQKVMDFLETQVSKNMSADDISKALKDLGHDSSWDRIKVGKACKELVDAGKMKVADPGGGKKPILFVSITPDTSSVPGPEEISDEVEKAKYVPEPYNDGYTAGYESPPEWDDNLQDPDSNQ